MDLAGRDTNSIAEVVLSNRVFTGGPQLQTCVGSMREIVVLNQVLAGVDEHTGIPHIVGFVVANDRLGDPFKHNSASATIFAPAKIGIMKVIGKVAALDQPIVAVGDLQSCFPAFGSKIFDPDARDSLGRNSSAFETLWCSFGCTDQLCSLTINRYIRSLDDDLRVCLFGIEHGALRDDEHICPIGTLA